MGNPRIAAKEPVVITLDPGTYYWCLCGRSRDQPFCDGSHQGTGFEPVEFTLSAKEEVALCQCKQTKTPPVLRRHTCDVLILGKSQTPSAGIVAGKAYTLNRD